jgi:cobalt-zinc-cadmium efflux system membrane fusion protein
MKISILMLSVLLLVFCGGQKNDSDSLIDEQNHQEDLSHGRQEAESHPEAIQGQSAEAEEHSDVHVSPEKQKKWGVAVGSATAQNISSILTLPGVLTFNQNQTAHISSYVEGKVFDIKADLGTRVKKGSLLLTINSPEFAQAQADFLEARARLNLSQKEFDRAKKLLDEKALEEKEFLRREAEYEKLMTEYGALGSALHSYGLTHEHIEALIAKCETIRDELYKCEIANPNLPILSPIAGTVVYRDVILGEHVSPEKTVFKISNLKTLWAQLDAYEKDLPFISKNSTVTILSPLYPDFQFEGIITSISETVDEKLRTIKIRVEVDNSEGRLKPNMYIQGKIDNISGEDDILVIPEDAVQNLNGEKVVFVLEEEDVFTARHIQLGQSIGNMRIITEGLGLEDKIAIKGAFYLKTELTKATFGHTHVH